MIRSERTGLLLGLLVLFAAFNLSLDAVIRFLPTATLGIVIAWAVWRTIVVVAYAESAGGALRSGSAATTLAGPAGYDRRGSRHSLPVEGAPTNRDR